MLLVTLTVVVVAVLVAALAIYLFLLGGLLGRISNDLKDCLQSVRKVSSDADPIGPGVTRLNKTAGDLLGAMPLLIDDADAAAAKLIPAPAPAVPARHMGYLDA